MSSLESPPPAKRAEKASCKGSGACGSCCGSSAALSPPPSCSGSLKEESHFPCVFPPASEADLQLKTAFSRLAVSSRKSSVSCCSTTLSLATLLPSSSSLHSEVSPPPLHSAPLLPPESDFGEKTAPASHHQLQHQYQLQQHCREDFGVASCVAEDPSPSLLLPQPFPPPSRDLLISHQRALALQQRIEQRQQQLVEEQLALLGQQQKLAEALRRSAWESAVPSLAEVAPDTGREVLADGTTSAGAEILSPSCSAECSDSTPVLLQQQRKRPPWMASRRAQTAEVFETQTAEKETSEESGRRSSAEAPCAAHAAAESSTSAAPSQPLFAGGEGSWLQHRRCQPWRLPREQSSEKESVAKSAVPPNQGHTEAPLSGDCCVSAEGLQTSSLTTHAHQPTLLLNESRAVQQDAFRPSHREPHAREERRPAGGDACHDCASLRMHCVDSHGSSSAFFEEYTSRKEELESRQGPCGGFGCCGSQMRSSVSLTETRCCEEGSRDAVLHLAECAPSCEARLWKQSCRGCLCKGTPLPSPSPRRLGESRAAHSSGVCRNCCSEMAPPCVCRSEASECLYTAGRASGRRGEGCGGGCAALSLSSAQVQSDTEAASKAAAAAASEANAAAAAAAVAALEVAAAAAAASPDLRLSAQTPQVEGPPVAARREALSETTECVSGCACCPPESSACDCEKESCLSERLGRGVLGRRRWKHLLRKYSKSSHRRASSSGRSSGSEAPEKSSDFSSTREVKAVELNAELPASVRRCLETRLAIRRQAMRESLELRKTFLRAAGNGEAEGAADAQPFGEGEAVWWLQQAEECFDREATQVRLLLQQHEQQRPPRQRRGGSAPTAKASSDSSPK